MDKSNVMPLGRRLEPSLPGCNCDGTGYVRVTEEGQGIVAPCVGCASRRIVAQFGGEPQTWANWRLRPELENSVVVLRAWFSGWRADRLWACLLHAPDRKDNFGSGKSHACQATAHEWAGHGLAVRYVVWQEHLEALREQFDSEGPRLSSLAEFDGLLILDDLGLEKDSPWTQEQLGAVTDWRYRHKLPTLVTTNLDTKALGARYPRLYSRCHEGVVIPWWAPDWRRR
jgi:hypothetical protein